MLIKTRESNAFKESQITDESVYLQRRDLLKKLAGLGVGTLLTGFSQQSQANWFRPKQAVQFKTAPLNYRSDAHHSEILTPENKVISHNNFYEFGAQKHQPAKLSQKFKVNPWQLTISGECSAPLTLDFDDLFKIFPLEERVYKLRCVEAWSMVIPWIGFSLCKLIKNVMPTSKAKYVLFETLYDPQQMPGQTNRRLGGGIDYPYVEGLRIDEAMNPLTLLSVGLYGKTLMPQNGAPIRLVVPWKYGFKSIKSIVSIKLVAEQPKTTWNALAPKEYGFYANVNPSHDHPRWSQASERLILSGGVFSSKRVATLPFNGYEEQVGYLYKGMNLRKYF